MNKKINIIIIFLVLGFITSPNQNFLLGQGASMEDALNKQIQDLNNGILDKKSQVQKIQDQQKAYEDQIAQKLSEKATLNNQVAVLDNRLAKAQLDIDLVQTEIDRVTLEIEKTDISISEKNQAISKELDNIANILGLIYKRDNESLLEIMLLNNSLADFLNQSKYLEDLNQNVGDSLDNLKQLKRQLENEKTKLDGQNKDLVALKIDLIGKKQDLAAEKDNKVYLLAAVNNSERQYQRLLAQAKKEQEQAAADIVNMEKQVRAKLSQLSQNKLELNPNGLMWPVPKNTITALFHDPDYPFRYIFEHPAIDIKAAQGTLIHAAADGYVAQAKNGGKGYSYIMLVHGDGISTVYGHVTQINVKNDDYVTQGQIIGRSGGMPGSPGAGPLTTGPHLHFEVRQNGIPVDPLSFLP